MNRGAVVAYVAKASSLEKALIKLLTVIPTKPYPKPIQRVCTKESEGIQVLFHPSHNPHIPHQPGEWLHLKTQ